MIRLLLILLLLALQASTLSIDRGASGAWQKLLKLDTVASVMHVTAHPDDEQGGLLAWLSRGQGARVSLLTLNRGEGGDNAIGPELFDALGLIRTEELRAAGRFYGLDRQYFTTAIDYGFSKRLEEALEKWGKEEVLGEVVRIIRLDRPLVIVSRFQGGARDGHGNHQAAGLIAREAFEAAGDPRRFPDQSAEGLQPWQPLKLYVGGVRADEDWTIRVDTGEYSPWVGDSYHALGRIGLSLQRSQTAGRLNVAPGPVPLYYRRVASRVDAPGRETSFFDGIDVSVEGLARAGRPPGTDGGGGEALREALGAMAREARAARAAFDMADPSAVAAALARGLSATRRAMDAPGAGAEAVFQLRIKERQFMDAIAAALGVELAATAVPAGVREPDGPASAFAPPPVLGPVVPGQTFAVEGRVVNRGRGEATLVDLGLETPDGWDVRAAARDRAALKPNEPVRRRFIVSLAEDAAVHRPHVRRGSLAENRYAIARDTPFFEPAPAPAAALVARILVEGVPVEMREIVRRREANLPYGYELRELKVLPALFVGLSPASIVVRAGEASTIALTVDLLAHAPDISGTVSLELPRGWTASPAAQPFEISRPGERRSYEFRVDVPALDDRVHRVEAVARAGGRAYREGAEIIRHRDLETRYLYRDAAARVRGVDLRVPDDLRVGYVMGVGDQVPAGIAQLGARVQLLGPQDLASADLSVFDALVTGTRAYAVREDLKTHRQRLMAYVRGGGHLVVLYNTQELDPSQHAPFPGELPRDAEEVSEEDAPVAILAPAHPLLTWPNAIGPADFDGWVEQRGSKFWRRWDPAYTALMATHDTGQPPQAGGWLTAPYGRGHYTYFAYALHRQLPYGVPGAYRLLANLLSLARAPAD